MRKDRFKKSVFSSLCCLGVASMLFVGSLSAYMVDKETADNVVTIGNNTIEIVENFQPPEGGYSGTQMIKKEVKVTNTESVPCYVRVYLGSTYSRDRLFMFKDAEEGDPNYNTTIMNKDQSDDVIDGWVYNSGDGWYYYIKPLGVGESTTNLITRVAYMDASGWSYRPDIDIYVYSESIQDMGMRNEFDVDDFAGEEEYDVVSTMYTWYKYWGNAPKKTVLPEGAN